MYNAIGMIGSFGTRPNPVRPPDDYASWYVSVSQGKVSSMDRQCKMHAIVMDLWQEIMQVATQSVDRVEKEKIDEVELAEVEGFIIWTSGLDILYLKRFDGFSSNWAQTHYNY